MIDRITLRSGIWAAAFLACAAGMAQPAIAQVVGDPAPVPPKTQGLAGTYYNNTGNNNTGLGPPPVPPPGSPIGTPNNGLSVLFLQRLDATVDFNFQTTPPPGVNNTPGAVDHTTVVWEGFVLAGAVGTYSFAVAADDGMRLWVNNLTVNPPPIDMWAQGGERPSNTIMFTTTTLNQRIPIRFEWYEHEGGAAARLRWDPTGAATAGTIIPATNLAPPDGPAAPTLTAASVPGATPQVQLNWNAPAGATGYILSRGVNGGAMTVYQILPGAGSTSFTDSGVSFGNTYQYIVQATSYGLVSIGPASATQNVTTPTISATPITGLQTNENGGTSVFNITLNVALAAGQSVTLTIQTLDVTEGQVSGGGQAQANSITIVENVARPAGYQIPITVTGLDDVIADPNTAYQVSVSATSTQTNLQGQTIPNIQLINVDNDTPGISVSRTGGLVTSENLTSDTFTVALTTQPSAPVTMTLTSSNPGEGTVSPGSITFNTAPGGANGWNVNQVVTVTGVDDAALDFAIAYTIITGNLSSGDGNYNTMTVPDVSVLNFDNEAIPSLPSVWGNGGGGGCGLTGLEVGLLIGLAALLGRRPRA